MLFLNNNLKIFSLFIITFTVVIKYPYCQQQFSFNFSKFQTTPMIYVTLLNNQVIAPLILGRPTLVSFFPLSNSSSLLPTSQIIRFKILTRIVTWLPPLPMASRHLFFLSLGLPRVAQTGANTCKFTLKTWVAFG